MDREQPLAIVTGGGTGIGRALTAELVRHGLAVLIVGRREAPLQETRTELAGEPGSIEPVAADVATDAGRERIIGAVDSRPVRLLVHNAALLEPIAPLAEVSLVDWRQHQAVNVEGPLFLTQALLGPLAGGRVLQISSGAAHHPYASWGAYCSSKAALHMLYQVWREELRERNIQVGSARPGVVDTPMQAHIRTLDAERFPHVERFRHLKANQMLVKPADAARFLAWLLLATTDREFSAAEWDINECAERWRAWEVPVA